MWPPSLGCFSILFLLYPVTSAGTVVTVGTYLYGTVKLPCQFPFVTGPQDLVVTWIKVSDQDNVEDVVVHSFQHGRDITEEQDPIYKGRTKMSKELSKGKLDLTLTDVTSDDEGNYICQAANKKDRDSKEIQLSITNDISITILNTNGKKRLKCISVGIYGDPQVKWHDKYMKNISSYASLVITDLGDGRKMVESVLEYPYETNKHYFCHVKDGSLKRSVKLGLERSARAVVSDGEHNVAFD